MFLYVKSGYYLDESRLFKMVGVRVVDETSNLIVRPEPDRIC